jgi:hypothetical protein
MPGAPNGCGPTSSKASTDCAGILLDGRPKNSIPAIDKPKLVLLGDVFDLAETETGVGVTATATVNVNGVSHAYPLRVLLYHKTGNDILGRIPVAVTYLSTVQFEHGLRSPPRRRDL